MHDIRFHENFDSTFCVCVCLFVCLFVCYCCCVVVVVVVRLLLLLLLSLLLFCCCYCLGGFVLSLWLLYVHRPGVDCSATSSTIGTRRLRSGQCMLQLVQCIQATISSGILRSGLSLSYTLQCWL